MARAKSVSKNNTFLKKASRVRTKAITAFSPSLVQKFFSYVRKDANECWRWKGCKNSSGYGEFFPVGHKGFYAHRIAYSWFVKEIPEDLFILHMCDTKDCVNPDHLFTGTQTDNMQDAVKKGIMHCGERSGNSKLKESDVIKIRSLYKTGKYFYRELAKMYKVNPSNVAMICNRKTWRHVL